MANLQVLGKRPRATIDAAYVMHILGTRRPESARDVEDPVVVLEADEAGARALVDEKMDARKKARTKGRVPAVAQDFIFAGPPAYAKREEVWSEEEELRFAVESLAWLKDIAGPNSVVVAAALHRDEASPHVHVLLVPIASDGRLSWTRVLDEACDRLSPDVRIRGSACLRFLHDDFYARVGSRFGLLRGAQGGRASAQALDWSKRMEAKFRTEEAIADERKADSRDYVAKAEEVRIATLREAAAAVDETVVAESRRDHADREVRELQGALETTQNWVDEEEERLRGVKAQVQAEEEKLTAAREAKREVERERKTLHDEVEEVKAELQEVREENASQGEQRKKFQAQLDEEGERARADLGEELAGMRTREEAALKDSRERLAADHKHLRRRRVLLARVLGSVRDRDADLLTRESSVAKAESALDTRKGEVRREVEDAHREVDQAHAERDRVAGETRREGLKRDRLAGEAAAFEEHVAVASAGRLGARARRGARVLKRWSDRVEQLRAGFRFAVQEWTREGRRLRETEQKLERERKARSELQTEADDRKAAVAAAGEVEAKLRRDLAAQTSLATISNGERLLISQEASDRGWAKGREEGRAQAADAFVALLWGMGTGMQELLRRTPFRRFVQRVKEGEDPQVSSTLSALFRRERPKAQSRD